ncbi:MAG TPA: flagellar hook-associated protein FlgL [Steroidobacteraceae bacterium]|nr:flagellar hook-associated protein FlgL [Steroidobacteraceae bacterium]
MRVTQNLEQIQFLNSLSSLESSLSQTQNGVSSGLSFTTPAQNPVAAGTVDHLNQVLSQSQQYTTNANSAQTSLNTENSTLTQVQNQLQSLYSLTVEANSGTLSSQNLTAIAAQATQIQSTLVSLANTQDGNGQYIFAGFATQNKPFNATAGGVAYSGDQGQRQAQIAAGQTIAVGDSGSTVFNSATGNGTYTVAANANNTGSGLIGATTVSNAAAYNGGTYTISFTGPAAYSINTVPPTTGTYTPGQAIAFNGLQISLSGQPATGDSFQVAPSSNQSLFTTVQNLITTLQAGVPSAGGQVHFGNSLAGSLNDLTQAISHSSTLQASVGARLNTITTQLSVATSQQAQLQSSISSLQSLDYPAAITKLDSENTQLSAAMQAFTLTQGLTLFKYIA